MLLKPHIFNGNTDSVSHEFEDVFVVVGEMSGLSASNPYDAHHTPVIATYGDVRQRNELGFLQKTDLILATVGKVFKYFILIALSDTINRAGFICDTRFEAGGFR